jgi:hypothetical protein
MPVTRLFVALRDRVLVVTGEGDGWSLDSVLEGRRPKALAAAGGMLFCGTRGHGVWRSADAGASWTRCDHPALGTADVMAIAAAVEPGGGHAPAVVSPATRGSETGVTDGGTGGNDARGPIVVYAGTSPSGVWRSRDGGSTWTNRRGLESLPSAPSWSFPPRPDTHHVRWLLVDPLRTERVYACIEAGALVRTTDGGATWTDRVPGGPRDTHTLRLHPRDTGRLYAAAGDGWFESRDFGESWERPREGLEHGYMWSVAVHPVEPELRLASAADGPRQAHDAPTAESFVYRRARLGEWERCTEGLPPARGTTAAALATDPHEPDTFWLACNRGVFRSRDAGASWAPIRAEWPAELAAERVNALVVL